MLSGRDFEIIDSLNLEMCHIFVLKGLNVRKTDYNYFYILRSILTVHDNFTLSNYISDLIHI